MNDLAKAAEEHLSSPEKMAQVSIMIGTDLLMALGLLKFRPEADDNRDIWRKEISDRMAATLFRPINALKKSPPGLSEKEGEVYLIGKSYGIFIDIETLFGDIEQIRPDELPPGLRPILLPEKEVDPTTIPEPWKSLLKQVETGLDETDKRIQEEKLKMEKLFLKGCADGRESLYAGRGQFTGETDALQVYMAFYFCYPLWKECGSVDEIYAFFKTVLGKELPHSIESFRKLCQRIGVRGRRYNDYRIRKKT